MAAPGRQKPLVCPFRPAQTGTSFMTHDTKFMTHDAKFEWWILAAIGLSLVVILVGGNHWIAGSVLLVLLIRAYPQRYVTTPDGLLIRAGLSNRDRKTTRLNSSHLGSSD